MTNVPTFAEKGLIVKELNGSYLLVEDEEGILYTYQQSSELKAELCFYGQGYRFLFSDRREVDYSNG